MADQRDIETVAKAIREMDWSGDTFDAEAIAAVALDAMTELPRRAKEVKAARNG